MALKVHGSSYLIADGAVGIASVGGVKRPKIVYAIHIISGGTAAVVSILNGGSGGTAYLKLTGTVSTGATFQFPEGILFPTDCYVDLDVNTTSVLTSYDEYP